MIRQVSIIGLGLMGGSLGLAIRRRKLAASVNAYARREETRKEALRRHVADRVFDNPADAVKGSDLVIFCVPVLSTAALAKECRPALAPGCIVTDVGSTKAEVVSSVNRIFKGSPAHFIGSHPIAGSDETGLDAARANLYENATVVVTPLARTCRRDVRRLAAFWEGLGSKVVLINPRDHDEIVAGTSHLPHLVAAILVSAVLHGRTRKTTVLCGTGFRDTTRIAGGSEDIWHDIVKSNKLAVRRELSRFSAAFQKVQKMVARDDFDGIRRFLADAREKRRDFAG